MNSKLQLLKELSKSGIVTLVLISVFAGYLIGHSPEYPFDLKRLSLTLLGILFLASGSSALNQYQERHLDAQMPRTAGRPLPSGRLSESSVLIFVGVSLGLGMLLLAYLGTSLLVLGLLAVLSYNGLYTLWWKKHWAYAAIPGAVPGALPVLMGHVAAQGNVLHPGAIYLFLILFFWQMPHFWVLALRYQEDYAKGGFPTLPVARGPGVTVHRIVLWCLAYVGLALIGPFFLKVSWIYFVPTLAISAWVVYQLFLFAKNPEGKKWLHFFLWVNFSLVLYLAAAVADLWSSQLLVMVKY